MIDQERQRTLDTALYLAVCNGDDAAVHRLLKSGADPNVKADGDRSAFSTAVYLKVFDLADAMIKHGALVNYQAEAGVSPPPVVAAILRDAQKWETARTEYLLARGLDLSVRFRWGGVSDSTIRQLVPRLYTLLDTMERTAMERIKVLLDTATDEISRKVQSHLEQQSRKTPRLKL